MFRKIVVALDGSEHAFQALTIACDIAQKYDATLTLLHVIAKQPIPPDVQRPAVKTAEKVYRKLEMEVAEKIFKNARALVAKHRLDHVETATVEGNPARAIVDFATAEGMDLILLGTRGLSGLHELVLGSVANRVSSLAACPVLTVK
jgi:nucleotide-binding universal stress UspA family protein